MAILEKSVLRAKIAPHSAKLVREVYEAACLVDAKFPDTHPASVAAKKVIAAFKTDFDQRLMWLAGVTPLGRA